MSNTKWVQAGAPIAVGIAFIVLWHALVVVNEVPPYIVPSPFLVMKTLVQDWGLLSGSLLVTLQVTGAALAQKRIAAGAVKPNKIRPVVAKFKPWCFNTPHSGISIQVKAHAHMAEHSSKEEKVKLRWAGTFREGLHGFAEGFGNLLVDAFHYLALFAIGGSIVWSAVVAFLVMAEKGHAAIDDILLLFIYLELGAMVGIYFKTNHMPVRFLIYVAMTALTRLLISDVQAHHRPDVGIVLVSGAILLLALATLVIRFGSSKFPSAHADGNGR